MTLRSRISPFYRAIAPVRVQDFVDIHRHRVIPALSWRLRPTPLRERWVERQLNLGGHYWLFVLGLTNSGTTMLASILKQHPLIRSLAREGQQMTAAFPQEIAHGVDRIWALKPEVFHWTEDSDPTPAARVRHDWAMNYARRPGILLEKSPTNSMRSRWLERHFSPCRFITIVRSPYAVCEGIRRRAGHEIGDAARQWARGHAILLADMERLERTMWFRYEDFCAAPADHLERIERFLELPQPFDLAVLRSVKAGSGPKQAITPLYDHNPESLERLSRADFDEINRIAGAEIEKLGYRTV